MLALIISLILTTLYTVVIMLVFFRCLKNNPFLQANIKRKVKQAEQKELKDQKKEQQKEEIQDTKQSTKGDKLDFNEVVLI